MKIRPYILFVAVTGLILIASCMGGPPPKPQKVIVSCARGVLPEKVKVITVIPFDTSSSESPLDGKDIASSFAVLLPDLKYTVKQASLLGPEFEKSFVRLTPPLQKEVLKTAKEKGIEGVVLGVATVKQGNTIYAVTLNSSTSEKILWSIYGENVTPQRMVIELKQKMYPE